jgi:flagellar biosynthesis protein FlhB
MADKDQRTEKPSSRRLHKAREDGQFPTSKEFVSALQFAAFLSIIGAYGAGWYSGVIQAVRVILQHAVSLELDLPEVVRLYSFTLSRIFVPLGIALGFTALVTLGLQLAVTGGGISTKKLVPNFTRFSPATKLQEIFTRGIPATATAATMLIVFGGLVYLVFRSNIDQLFLLPLAQLQSGLHKVWLSVDDLLWKAAGIFILFGVVDLVRQRRRFTNDLKMSKQEIRDELKESEGNPQLKHRIRQLRRDLLRRRMMKDLKTATAVIVNPTHFAVAIRYSHEVMATPVVVAKGKNYLALRIRQKCIEYQIPLIENPPLAQALYKSVEVGQEIPPHLYRAIAEILAYVYRLMNVNRSAPRR